MKKSMLVDQSVLRKKLKKKNLADAKSYFPYKHTIEKNRTPAEVKKWMIKNRYRNWKQKGLLADYYTKDHRTLWFKEEKRLFYFVIAF